MTEELPFGEEFIVFGRPDIREAEIAEVVDSLSTGWLGTGPKVARLEEAFAIYRQAQHAVAVNSCTAALHLSMLACPIEPGDEVITTALTFCATVNAIIHAGGTPVLADVDPKTMNIDVADVSSKITPRTRAVIPVHFAGRPCEMDPLMNLAEKHDLYVIEDCAHAIEAEYKGRPVGTFGDFGCFSFYVTKNVVTGEGGMVLADRADHAARIKMLALHGLTVDAWRRFSDAGYKHYYVAEPGFKYNMMDIQAAIGLHQLARVEESARRRVEIWARYDEAFGDLDVSRPAPLEEDGSRHARHLYTLLLGEDLPTSRDAFLEAMTAKQIGVGVHYLSIPEHPYYRERFSWSPEDCPVATDIGRRTVSLPLSSRLTDSEVDRVVRAVREGVGAERL